MLINIFFCFGKIIVVGFVSIKFSDDLNFGVVMLKGRRRDWFRRWVKLRLLLLGREERFVGRLMRLIWWGELLWGWGEGVGWIKELRLREEVGCWVGLGEMGEEVGWVVLFVLFGRVVVVGKRVDFDLREVLVLVREEERVFVCVKLLLLLMIGLRFRFGMIELIGFWEKFVIGVGVGIMVICWELVIMISSFLFGKLLLIWSWLRR